MIAGWEIIQMLRVRGRFKIIGNSGWFRNIGGEVEVDGGVIFFRQG